jgi:hypothetical protein
MTKYIIKAKNAEDQKKCEYKVFDSYADAVSFINVNNIRQNVIKAIKPTR